MHKNKTQAQNTAEMPITNTEDIDISRLTLPPEPTNSIVIDRDEEDKDVASFQKTGDLKLLEKLYKQRIPTLHSWANKYYYPGLVSSVEDLFAELSVVFVKAAEKYDKKRGAFNTCLYTFLLNRIKNLKSSKHAKKRISDDYTGPLCGMILSLDFAYNDKDGSAVTLKDIIPSEASEKENFVLKEAMFDETVKVLSENNPQFEEFLLKISEGGSLASLLKEHKTKSGSITVKPSQANKLKTTRSKKMVVDLLRAQHKISGDFVLVDYDIVGHQVNYVVEMKKTDEVDNILKTIRELRKNKELYLNRIKGLSTQTA